MLPTTKYLIVVAGPTAVGKTAAAISIAQALNTEIVSCDSRQFFREMNIGTAKPTADELAAVPHWCINNCSIAQAYTVGDFEREALAHLDRIFQKHTYAVLCGGSGLYIKAITHGLDDFPDIPAGIRANWNTQYAQHGIGYLQVELEKLDPTYYAQVDKANPQRLLRALEVCQATGQPYSSFLRHTAVQRPFTVLRLALDLPREVLYKRINQRVENMMHEGLLQEVTALYPYRQHNALHTVGYQEIFDYLDGKFSLDEAVAKIQQNTRRYAKRQLTWFRHEANYTWFAPTAIAEMLQYIEERQQSAT